MRCQGLLLAKICVIHVELSETQRKGFGVLNCQGQALVNDMGSSVINTTFFIGVMPLLGSKEMLIPRISHLLCRLLKVLPFMLSN